MFEVMNPSWAFKVETVGCCPGSGQSVRYPSEPLGTTVALNTYPTATSRLPVTIRTSRSGLLPVSRQTRNQVTFFRFIGSNRKNVVVCPLVGAWCLCHP